MRRYRVTTSIGIPDRAFDYETDPVEAISDTGDEIVSGLISALRTFAVDNPLYADPEEFDGRLEEVVEDGELS